MLSKQEVKHIAKLARLGLTQGEIKKFQKELSLILDYIEKLNELDVTNIKPEIYSAYIENIMRSDENQKLTVKSQKLIDLMPATKDGYLKVKSILK